MFSLIKFHNEKFAVVSSKNVEQIIKKTCVVKCNGGKYSAFFVAKNNNKSYLLDLKRRKEEVSTSPIESKTKKPLQSFGKTKSSVASSSSFTDFCHTQNQLRPSVSLSPKKANVEFHKKTIAFDSNKLNVLFDCDKIPNSSETTKTATNTFKESTKSPFQERQEKPPEILNEGSIITSLNSYKTKNSIQCGDNSKLVLLFDSNKKILPLKTVNTAAHTKSNFQSPQEEALKMLKESLVISPQKDNSNGKSIQSENETLKISVKTLVESSNLDPIKVNSKLYKAKKPIQSENSSKLVLLFDSDEKLLSSESNKMSPTLAKKTVQNCNDSLITSLKNVDSMSRDSIDSDTNSSKLVLFYGPDENVLHSEKENTATDTIIANTNSFTQKDNSKSYISSNTNDNRQIISFDRYKKLLPSKNEKTLCNTNDETLLTSVTLNTSTEALVTSNESLNCNSTCLSDITLKPDISNNISSVYSQESYISEYMPESICERSENVADKSHNISENNLSVEITESPLNVEKVIVPHSINKAKKHFCIFCHKLQSKIGRHLLQHKNEKEIKRALLLPKKCKERLNIINKLRKNGDFLHNTSAVHNSGILIVSRQQQKKFKNKADDYVCCQQCKGFFSKKTLRLHAANCVSSKKKRFSFIESRRLTQYIHSLANKVLRTKVFPVMRDDEVSRSVRYDELILKFGNKLTEKYSSEHQHDMIRSNLRLLGRFKIELKKLDPKINELKDIFKPELFDTCVNALRLVANWDDNLMWFKTPAVAQSLTSLIKKCGKKQRAELIKENCEDLKSNLENFLLLWEEEIPTLINKKAVEDQTNQKRVKKVLLPSKEDIKKLYLYLKENIIKAMDTLMSEFCMSSWTQLVQSTLIFVQIFNRRRAGEIERLTVENFANKEQITDNIDKDMIKNISMQSIKYAKQFVRITLRGKLGRTVSVLLCPLCLKAVKMIMKYRSEAGVASDNQYIFCKPSTSKLMKQYYRACPLLKKFSEECGARIPESLRGTTLRKHIATHTSLLNVEDASIDKLANFMGHHKDIHKAIYRMSVPVAEITCVSKLLMAALGDEEEMDDEYIEEDIEDDKNIENCEKNCEENAVEENMILNSEDSIHKDNSDMCENSLQSTHNSSTSSNKKRRSTSPFGKTKRSRWSDEEKDAVYSIFGDLGSLERLPSLKECLKAIGQTYVLKRRTPQQIKTWIDNQRRYKTK